MCYCSGLPTVETDTRIVVLQHPHERTHPFGTARLVRMCLPNASLHVPFAGFTGTLEHRVDVPERAAVLFPHPDAPDLAELPAHERPDCLIAIDGTWSHAKRLYRENEWLHALPHVRLSPSAPSRYRIRKEPRADYISTLEAIVEALRIIEPQAEGLDDLLAAFDRMIDRQIDHFDNHERSARFRVTRERPSRARSPLLADPRLVVVYAEAPLAAGRPEADRHVVQWVAGRVDGDDDDTFEAFVVPPELPSERHLAHMRITREQIAGGVPLAEAARRFREWLGDGDVPIATWTGSTIAWGRDMLPDDCELAVLKTSYCNTAQRRAGYLEQLVEREDLTVRDNPCHGRAGRRLARAIAVARWLRTHGIES